jgi:hypothetical protein
MNTLSEAQAKLAALKSEKARIDLVLTESLGAAEAEVSHIKGALAAIASTAADKASEWAESVIAGASGAPPLPTDTMASDVLSERLASAERRAAVERVAKAPVVARRDELIYLVRLATEAVEKSSTYAIRVEGRRVFQEVQAALSVARELADTYEALGGILSAADWAGLPVLPAAIDMLPRNPHRIKAAEQNWRALYKLLQAMPEATLAEAIEFAAFQTNRAREQAAAQ